MLTHPAFFFVFIRKPVAQGDREHLFLRIHIPDPRSSDSHHHQHPHPDSSTS